MNNIFCKILNRLKTDFKELYEISHDEKKSFRLNRILSNNISIAVIITAMDILFLLLFNYIINIVSQLGKIMQNMDKMSAYFGLGNIFISMNLIKTCGFVRTLYIFFCVILVILDLIFLYNIHISFSEKNFNMKQKGDDRWTTLEEIKLQYLEIDEVETEYDGMPGFPISRYKDKLYIDTNNTNNLIIGITRAGKGEAVVVPSFDTYSRASIKPSIIIGDMKAEHYKSCQKNHILQNRGYDVFFLNLQNPVESMGYNPLEIIIEQWECGNQAYAEDLTQTFVWQIFDPESATSTEKYFAETGAFLTSALILAHVEDCLRMDQEVNQKRKNSYDIKTNKFKKLSNEAQQEVREQYKHYLTDVLLDPNVDCIPDDVPFMETHEYRKMINMYSIINTYFELVSCNILDEKGNPTGKTKLDSYFTERPIGNRAKLKYMSTNVAGSNTKGSVYSTMNTKLTIYTLETVAKMTAESSVDILKIGFGEKPIAIFLGIPDADDSKYQLATTFIRQVYTVLSAQCWDGGVCARPVKFILDEFGNMPPLEGMASMITVCAGRNITFDLYVQSYSMLEEKYGQTATTIRTNCGNKVFVRTDDDSTLEEFVKKVGTETIVSIQRTGSKLSLDKTFMETVDEKPLIRATELKNLMQGESVVVRTMKTKDNNGEDVKMYAIKNTKENGQRLKFRYEYLEDYFPSPRYISLKDVLEESRSHIKLKQRLWNPDLSFYFINKDSKPDGKKIRLGDLEENIMNPIIDALHKIIVEEKDKNLLDDIKNIDLEIAESMIESETDTSKIDLFTRNSLLSAINHCLANQ